MSKTYIAFIYVILYRKNNFMKRISKAVAIVATTLLLGANTVYAQSKPIVKQDGNLDALLELKEKLESDNKLFNGYTIQLHNGDLNKAKARKKEYENTKSVWPASIEYETPNYKLWIGNFETRLDADRALLKLRKEFPSAFVLKLDRK